MATDVIKTKELPIVGQQVDVTLYDRLVASHQVTSDMRATTGIPIGLLAERFMAQDVIGQIASKNLFGTDAPDSETGMDGDMYFQLEGSEVISVYVKYSGTWLLLALGDDNWSAFLAGQPFDLISMDAESVAAYAFQHNRSIRRVIMPSCKNVYDYAFNDASITGLSMTSVEHIWPHAFDACTSLRGEIDLRTCRWVDDYAFQNCNYTSGTGTDTFIRLRDAETIGTSAFYSSGLLANYLLDLNLPYCKTIGSGAFSTYYDIYKAQFNSIILPRVESIGTRAFGSVSNITKTVQIGPYIESMGQTPFQGGTWVEGATFTIEAVEPPELFTGLEGDTTTTPPTARMPAHIYVPAQSVDAYKEASVWSFYASVIEAIPEEVNANE